MLSIDPEKRPKIIEVYNEFKNIIGEWEIRWSINFLLFNLMEKSKKLKNFLKIVFSFLYFDNRNSYFIFYSSF
jgi:hypothetical protein